MTLEAPGDLTIAIDAITVEGVRPEEAERVRAVIEAALAAAARRLAGRAAGARPATSLGTLRFDMGTAGNALAPGAESALARKLEAAILAAWEAAP
jgi:hypothetical protein